MKRIILIFALAVLLLSPAALCAQTLTMDEGYVAFDYPESWLVVSPQLCGVYAPLLTDAGLDPEALREQMEQQHILSRAYNADFSQSMSVLIASDELSAEIFDIEEVTDDQRSTLRRRVENDSLWETTGLRAQDVEWQKENGVYWLYVHYTRTYADETIGRGLRYITVRNGMYVMLDWQIDEGRFGNRDLSAFRARLADVTITKKLARPMGTVKLTAQIPTETSTADVTITGTTTAGATLLAEAPDASGQMQTLSVGEAGQSGSFSLLVPLEQEGTYVITLTASVEGMHSASATGTLTYSAKTLPVSGIVEHQVVSSDTVKLSGTTLAGVQMQLVTPFGVTKKRSGNDGSFSFELTTEEEGTYNYTLILDKDGYDQRRVQFTIVREITDEQERQRIRDSAQKISYKVLQEDREENRGAVMSLYGPVSEISQSGSTYYVRMQFNKGSDGVWFNPVVIVADSDMGVKVGDMMTVVVSVAGVYEEQDASGAPVMVPRFDLLFVDKVE